MAIGLLTLTILAVVALHELALIVLAPHQFVSLCNWVCPEFTPGITACQLQEALQGLRIVLCVEHERLWDLARLLARHGLYGLAPGQVMLAPLHGFKGMRFSRNVSGFEVRIKQHIMAKLRTCCRGGLHAMANLYGARKDHAGADAWLQGHALQLQHVGLRGAVQPRCVGCEV
jgi:hypothetical protein